MNTVQSAEEWVLHSLKPIVWHEDRALGPRHEPVATFRPANLPAQPELIVTADQLTQIISEKVLRMLAWNEYELSMIAISEIVTNLIRHGYPENISSFPLELIRVRYRISTIDKSFEIVTTDIAPYLSREKILQLLSYSVGDGLEDAHGRGLLIIQQKYSIHLRRPVPTQFGQEQKEMRFLHTPEPRETPIIEEESCDVAS